MTSYTFGSVEAVQALLETLRATPAPHEQNFGPATAAKLAQALETADFAGCDWARRYTGWPVEQGVRWWSALGRMHLSTGQALGLVEAMVIAFELGDDFAGQWLGYMADAYGVEWI